MIKSTTDNNKKGRGRPVVNSTFVGVRIPPSQLYTLDLWIAEQKDKPTRPEAIRRILKSHFSD